MWYNKRESGKECEYRKAVEEPGLGDRDLREEVDNREELARTVTRKIRTGLLPGP